VTEVRNLLVSAGAAAAREGIIVKDRAITFEHVTPGRNIVCAVPLPGNPNDPQVQAMFADDVELPVFCEIATIAASPEHSDVTIEVPAPR
jgi:hypothetical protein